MNRIKASVEVVVYANTRKDLEQFCRELEHEYYLPEDTVFVANAEITWTEELEEE